MVVVGGRGETFVDSGAHTCVAIVIGLSAVDSSSGGRAGDGRQAFGAGDKSGIRMTGSGDVGDVDGVAVTLVAASGLAAAGEGCDYSCDQGQSCDLCESLHF